MGAMRDRVKIVFQERGIGSPRRYRGRLLFEPSERRGDRLRYRELSVRFDEGRETSTRLGVWYVGEVRVRL